MSSQNNTVEIIANFTSNVDITKSYTLKEMLSILTKAYPRDKKKREPSLYNIYMKDKMAEIKKSNPELNNKEVMNTAAKEWGNNKNNITQSLVKEEIVKEEIVKEEKNSKKKKAKK